MSDKIVLRAFESEEEPIVRPKRGSSVFSSVLNLSNTILGTGILALPAAFKDAGIILGCLFAIISAGMAACSLHLLTESARLAGSASTCNFYSVCEAALPRLSLLVDGVVVLSTFAGAMAYMIVSTDCLVNIAGGGTPRWPWTLLTLAIVTPFCFLRRLDALKYTSLAALCTLMAISVMVILFAARVPGAPLLDPCSGSDGSSNSSECRGHVRLFTTPLHVLRAFAVFVNAYICQQNLFAVNRELEQPTRARTLRVTIASLSLALCLYLTVALAGVRA